LFSGKVVISFYILDFLDFCIPFIVEMHSGFGSAKAKNFGSDSTILLFRYGTHVPVRYLEPENPLVGVSVLLL
jgi:hypothetical protein